MLSIAASSSSPFAERVISSPASRPSVIIPMILFALTFISYTHKNKLLQLPTRQLEQPSKNPYSQSSECFEKSPIPVNATYTNSNPNPLVNQKILTTKLICVYTVLQQPWAIAMIPKQKKYLKAKKRQEQLALLTTEGT